MSKKIVKRVHCPFCNDGTVGLGPEECVHCGGVGEYGTAMLSYECETCETTGKVDDVECEDCSGNGYIPLDFEVIEGMVEELDYIHGKVTAIWNAVKPGQ